MRRIEILPGANRHKRPSWAEFIFALDGWLRRREGVFEYSHKPDCIFRAQLSDCPVMSCFPMERLGAPVTE